MIRALYTAASGMNAQQANIDNVAQQPRQRQHDRLQEEPRRVRGPRLPADARPAPRRRRRPKRRSGSRPGSARAAGGDRARLQHAATCGRPAVRSTSPSRATASSRCQLPDGDDRLHARRRAPLNGEGGIVTADGYAARAANHDSAERHVGQHLEGRHRVGVDSRPDGAQQVGTIELASFQNPAGLTRARRQPVRRDDRLGRADDRRAGHGRHAARSRRDSSRTPTSASSRRWST